MSHLPKFLIADDVPQAALQPPRTFIVHAHEPYFIAEVLHHGDEEVLNPHWLDGAPDDLSRDHVLELMQEASAFYHTTRRSNQPTQN
ncbi:MAG: hypothetical protein QOF48_3721 [Verrucomicrobiota bacterium]|jgi:hypothetical protein